MSDYAVHRFGGLGSATRTVRILTHLPAGSLIRTLFQGGSDTWISIGRWRTRRNSPSRRKNFGWPGNMVEAVESGRVTPMRSPSQKGTVSIDDGGEVIEIGFNDTPYTRTMFAIRDLFGRGNPKWMACHMRLEAVGDLREDPRHWRWLRNVEGSWRIFEGMLDAAATVQLYWLGEEEGWTFKADEFFAAVEAIYASGKYSYTGEVW
jgi:hypothetical protein